MAGQYNLNNARATLAGLLDGGLNPVRASGFLGNFMEESTLNPGAFNKKEGAFGLGQWRGSRRQALEQFAGKLGLSPTDAYAQGRFAAHEIQTDPQYAGAWKRLQAATTPEAAADAVVHYEKPGGWKPGDATGVPSYQDRIDHAKNLYAALQGGGAAPTQQMAQAAPAGTGPVSAAPAAQNPYALQQLPDGVNIPTRPVGAAVPDTLLSPDTATAAAPQVDPAQLAAAVAAGNTAANGTSDKLKGLGQLGLGLLAASQPKQQQQQAPVVQAQAYRPQVTAIRLGGGGLLG